MFTRSIKHTVQLRKSGVRWKVNAPASAPAAGAGSENVDLLLAIAKEKLESNKKQSDHFIAGREVNGGLFSGESVRDILQKVMKMNKDKKAEIDKLITDALSAPEWSTPPEKKKILEDLKKTIESDFKEITGVKEIAERIVVDKTINDQRALRSTVVDTQTQTTALKKILEGENSVGAKALLTAISEREDTSGEVSKKVTDINLPDTTLGSVVLALLALDKKYPGKDITADEFKKSYISNGAYWLGDSTAIESLLKVFNKKENRTDIVKAFQKVAPVYQALGTTVEYEKNKETVKVLTPENLLGALAVLPRFEGDQNKNKNIQSLKKILESIPESERVTRIKGIISLGGGSLDASDVNGVITALKANPSLLSQYHAGMNLLGLRGPKSLGDYMRTGKYELAPDVNNIEKQMKDIVESARDKGAKNVAASAMTDGEKTKALAEIDKRYQIARSPESIRTYAYHATALMTNEGLGIAGSVTTDMRSAISDSISAGLFAGIGDGKFDLGASLLASKSLHASQSATFDLFYGLSASKEGVLPVAGFKGSYGDFLYSVYANKLGAGAFLGTRTGTNQHSAEDMRAIAETPAAVKTMIEAGLKNKADFKIDTGNPESNMWINTRIQQLLTAGEYQKLTAEQKPIALHSALVDAVRERANMVKEMMKNNGLGLSAIGLNFGKFAGLTYVIPGFSWSKVDTYHMTSVSEGATTTERRGTMSYNIINRQNPDTAIFDKALPENLIIPIGSELSTDRMKITKLDPKKNITLGMNNGKLEVKYDGDVNNIPQSAIAGLKNTVEMKEVISDTQIRSALAYLGAVSNKGKFGEVLKFIDVNINIASSNFDGNKEWIGNELKPRILSLITGKVDDPAHSKTLKEFVKTVRSEDDPKKILEIARTIRDALMTDRLQASMIGKVREATGREQTNLQYYRNMIKSKGFEAAVSNTGFSMSDFDQIMPQNADKIGYTPTRREGMIGAVATWKFPPAHMAYLPAGAIWMSSEPKVTTKKAEAIKTLSEVAQGSIFKTELVKVKEQLKTPFGRELTDHEMNQLLLGNEVKNGNKTLKLDTTFYTFAYGACMNPSVGMEIGKYTIIEPGMPTATGTATIETTIPGGVSYDMAFSTTSSMSGGSIGIGGANIGETVRGGVSTTPGNGTINPGNGSGVGVGAGGFTPTGPTAAPLSAVPMNPAAGLAQAAIASN